MDPSVSNTTAPLHISASQTLIRGIRTKSDCNDSSASWSAKRRLLFAAPDVIPGRTVEEEDGQEHNIEVR
jgi:hypothetical protein